MIVKQDLPTQGASYQLIKHPLGLAGALSRSSEEGVGGLETLLSITLFVPNAVRL